MENKKGFDVGDRVPLDKAERSDTFYLVTIEGKKYLVDQTGKIVLKPADAFSPSSVEDGAFEPRAVPLTIDAAQLTEPLKFRVKPGTVEFTQAVTEAKQVIEYFKEMLRRCFRQFASQFGIFLANNRAPFVKYIERGKNGLSSLKAYLIREFFRHTTIQQRGMIVFEFLTEFIAIKLDGSFSMDRMLPSDQQRDMVLGFLDFLSKIGDTPSKKRVIEKTYFNFINQEYELMKSEGGAGYYITSSLTKTLTAQKELLMSHENRNYLESTYRQMVRSKMDFYLENILAYIKTLAILRLMANSRKEDRGRDEDERENLLYEIIAFRPAAIG